jgi:hypothetical protein
MNGGRKLIGAWKSRPTAMVRRIKGTGRERGQRRTSSGVERGRGMARAVLAMDGRGKSLSELAGMALEATIREDRGMGRNG